MVLALQTENLCKTFGRGKKQVKAVKNLELSVESEQVFGFLGPNGAGKSTTIRMLMDLIRPTQGRALVYGQDVRREPEVLERVGALVEGASFYNFMTGRDNLKVLSHTAADGYLDRVDDLLEQVGLADRADRNVGNYSTGMKQRLGIAAALLSDPDLIILDEPTNGLDPAGIQEMRGFIRSLAHEHGKTVFLSSHLLSEVEQVCDRVAIIHRGELVRTGKVEELLAGEHRWLRLQVSPTEKALKVLSEHWTIQTDPAAEGWLQIQSDPESSSEIVRQLVAQDIDVHQIVAEQQSLEAYFMAVTNQEGDHD
jgi:ABC-2 type transport system ATP-binding protein